MSAAELQAPEIPVETATKPMEPPAEDPELVAGAAKLSLEDATEEAAKLKAEGNDAFKSKAYSEAVEKYSKALAALKEAEADPDPVILSNRSGGCRGCSRRKRSGSSLMVSTVAAYIMLQRYVPALRDAQQAGELRPDFWKAFWRQGVALMRMTPKKFRSRAAIAAFEKCAQCSDLPESKVRDVNAELAKARARLAEQEADTPMPEQCRPS
eukprot:scaffold1954_cov268-Pinguiococcus_pyrenoidosus.AAC.274